MLASSRSSAGPESVPVLVMPWSAVVTSVRRAELAAECAVEATRAASAPDGQVAGTETFLILTPSRFAQPALQTMSAELRPRIVSCTGSHHALAGLQRRQRCLFASRGPDLSMRLGERRVTGQGAHLVIGWDGVGHDESSRSRRDFTPRAGLGSCSRPGVASAGRRRRVSTKVCDKPPRRYLASGRSQREEDSEGERYPVAGEKQDGYKL